LVKNSKKIGMNFLVVEGVDGSGKSTQINLLKEFLKNNEIPYQYLHFPRTETGIYGDLVARFLRGDFGDLNNVDPYLVALIYAGDRKDASLQIREWLNKGFLVLLDRYVYSNIAFQCAKLSRKEDQVKLRQWILNLEYNYHAIPRPDLNILLNVPFSFTEQKLSGTREGSERNYLQGMRDIHEDDLEFQKRVREMYIWQAKECEDLKIINCTDDSGNMQPPEVIFSQVLKQIGLKNA
jgi:dTMP kinase